jgi:tripartite ATP-independent transporter DctM subunit
MNVLKIIILVLALFRSPLFLVFAALALVSFYSADIDISVVIIEMSRLADTPLLVSLPLFIFIGVLLSEGNTPTRILHFFRIFLGWMPGGLAVVTLLVCSVFTAFTGASGITIFALGGLLLPALLEEGYPERFSMGLITSCGSLGLLFPPSLPLILFGVIAEARIDHLFLAGILPGFLMLVLLIGYSLKKSPPRQARPVYSAKEILQGLHVIAWELPLPVILLGGIYGGIFVPGEAAAVTAFYALAVEVLVHRDIPLKQLPLVMSKSMVMFGGILVVLAASMASTNFLIDQEVPTRFFEFLQLYIHDKYSFLLLLNVFLLLVGAMLNIFSALVLIVPLILPIAKGYGVDPIHLGIIFLTNLQIGYCLPPIGMDLFLASYRFERPITELFYSTLPFNGILLITLLIITYFPWLSTVLIHLLG